MPRIHPQLPYEIIQSEVLPRLPAKSIGRFRCVCKAWNSFLSTPEFAQMHLPYQTNHKLLLLDHHTSPTFRTLDCEQPMSQDSITTTLPIPFQGHMSILASLDGLVCVALRETRELAFWNPVTGAYNKFHTSFYKDMFNGAFALYIDSSNDYKLVHIVSEGAFIYSQRLDLWRKINHPSLDISELISNYDWSLATFFEGKVYFRLLNRSLLTTFTSERCIISFDVESEKFKEIQCPCSEGYGASLVVLNGCIHLGVVDDDGLKCDLWRMDGDGWIKVAAFSHSHKFSEWLIWREIHIKKNGNLLAIWEDNDSFKNVDMEDLLTDFYYVGRGNWPHENLGAIYIETLVSPNP
ncbi:putative F-box domain-containing protein [Helianthus annuus]|nr:putative F-box domain-containing protein [Helianthus annuus]